MKGANGIIGGDGGGLGDFGSRGFVGNDGDGGDGGFGGGAGAGNGFGGFGGVDGDANVGGGGASLGGAIFNMGADAHDSGGQVILVNCTFTANSAVGGGLGSSTLGSGLGGALFNLDGMATLNNDTLALNDVLGANVSSSPTDGGAIYNLAFANDIDTDQPLSAALFLNNSILATSSGGNDLGVRGINGAGTNTAAIGGRNNLVMSNDGIAAGVIVSTANPELGPLQNNGGLTQTMLPQAGSPVLGAGSQPQPHNRSAQRRSPAQRSHRSGFRPGFNHTERWRRFVVEFSRARWSVDGVRAGLRQQPVGYLLCRVLLPVMLAA